MPVTFNKVSIASAEITTATEAITVEARYVNNVGLHDDRMSVYATTI
jgi:hypothetical protein